ACLEEIAFANGWLTKKELLIRSSLMSKNSYGQYLLQLIK
ncbi:glucose-1-phosphate thymidylyltransferase, partial [Escherichia coli]|nr:glucose-1-phosphate thymidylyltransferase [Escherichia coli]